MRTLLTLLALAGAAVSAKLVEENMDALQLISHNGYCGEQHTVITGEGSPYARSTAINQKAYRLTVFRIPHRRLPPDPNHKLLCNMTAPTKPRPVIFLQHGLECSCTNWLTNLPSESAAFVFADAGFDVWMGNFRGNYYSSQKMNPHLSNKDFWDFSWDEMALQDLPAMIDYVLGESGAESLYYMGHSEGTMTPFALFSSTHDYDAKVKRFFALGPVTTVEHIGGFLGLIKGLGPLLGKVLMALGQYDFLPENWVTKMAAKYICGWAVLDKYVCSNILFLIAGPDTSQMNETRVPIYIAHTPSGTSTKNVIHFVQGTTTPKYQMHDYGKRENQKKYGQDTPPQYDLSNVNVPTYLYAGTKDVLADPTDVRQTILPNVKTIKKTTWLDFNHLDFIWGLNARSQVYDSVIRTIAKEDGLDLVIPPRQ